ncbi:hypothetical protein ABZ499_28985 [Streptomyces sp. NPDC019990]|uniref:hypothetical protein n=1 Tax=Streptomyces sp. NPDC019990 TaxID=3154693 RepID=UPI0033EDCAEA
MDGRDQAGSPARHLRFARPPGMQHGEYLGVPWEFGMLDYGSKDHGTFRPRLGDGSSTIKSGRIQPARTAGPDLELPPRLRESARAWGYSS